MELVEVVIFKPNKNVEAYSGGQMFIPIKSVQLIEDIRKEKRHGQRIYRRLGTTFLTAEYIAKYSKDGIVDLTWIE